MFGWTLTSSSLWLPLLLSMLPFGLWRAAFAFAAAAAAADAEAPAPAYRDISLLNSRSGHTTCERARPPNESAMCVVCGWSIDFDGSGGGRTAESLLWVL